MNIKKSVVILVLFLMLGFLNACKDDTNDIGGYFVNAITEAPIANLQVGLYKGIISSEATYNDLELLQQTTTDANGNFLFETEEEELTAFHYLPIPSNDSSSVNSKYVISLQNVDQIDWSKNKKWTLWPSVEAKIFLSGSIPNDSIMIACDHQNAYGATTSDSTFYSLLMTPSEQHEIEFWRKTMNGYQLEKKELIYIQSTEINYGTLIWMKPTELKIIIQLINY